MSEKAVFKGKEIDILFQPQRCGTTSLNFTQGLRDAGMAGQYVKWPCFRHATGSTRSSGCKCYSL